MMKYYIYVFALIFTCCKKTDTMVKKGDFPKECSNSNGSIHKFRKLSCDTLYNNIVTALRQDQVSLDDATLKTIKQWVENKVMGAVFPDENIVEWNLYDEDFCQNRVTRIEDTQGQLIDSVEIPICNTRLSRDVSCGSTWTLNLTGALSELRIEHCDKTLETQKRVGYYEVIRKNDKLERSPTNYQFKRSVVTDIYLSYRKTDNVICGKKIYSGNAIAYDALGKE